MEEEGEMGDGRERLDRRWEITEGKGFVACSNLI